MPKIRFCRRPEQTRSDGTLFAMSAYCTAARMKNNKQGKILGAIHRARPSGVDKSAQKILCRIGLRVRMTVTGPYHSDDQRSLMNPVSKVDAVPSFNRSARNKVNHDRGGIYPRPLRRIYGRRVLSVLRRSHEASCERDRMRLPPRVGS